MIHTIKLTQMSSVFALGLTACLFACSHNPPVPADAVAVWRGGTITTNDIEGWLSSRGKAADRQDLPTTCEDIALVLALADETEDLGVDTTTTEKIDAATNALLVKSLRRDMASQITISDEEIDAAYLKFPQAFHKPQKLRLRNLFLSFPLGASDAEKQVVRTRMLELQRRLREGEDFSSLAEKESHSQTRFKQGLIGNVAPGQLPAPIDAVAMQLAPGEISEIIENPDGLTIFKCDRVIEAKSPTPDEVRAGLAKNLRRIEEKKRWEALTLELGGDDRSSTTFKIAAAERARNLGLDKDPKTAAAILWTRRQHLATEAIRRRVESEMKNPTESEVHQYFDANPSLFTRPETFELAIIRMDYGEDNFSAVHRDAATLSYNLRNGRLDFSQTARIHSDDPSASMGGKLALMTRRQMAGRGPEFMKTVMGLEIGGISRELTADGSVWIVRLDAQHPARQATFDEAADQTRKKLGQERVNSLQEAIEDDIRIDLDVTILQ